MRVHPGTRSRLSLAATLLVLGSAPVRAQMVPVSEVRRVDARAHFGDIEVEPPVESVSPPFSRFEKFLHVVAEYPPAEPPNPEGFSEAYAYQISEFFPGAIYATGYTGGSWQQSGSLEAFYEAHSIALTTFRVDTCIEYAFNVTVDPGDPGTFRYVELRTSDPFTRIHRTEDGEHTFTGRLSPGEYTIDSISSMTECPSSFLGATFSYVWTCNVCPSALIAQHPVDTAVFAGSPLTLSVVPTTPTGTLTYQWRRDLVPLVNGANIGGATTSTLTIFNPTVADTGAYDVVLTEGAIVEPSSLAHVTLGGVTGVDPVPGPGTFMLEPAVPNPSASASTFRYVAARPVRMTAAIHDAAGRRVRVLEDGSATGEGVLTWDGRTESGARVAAGLYFLNVRADGETHIRRVVRLP